MYIITNGREESKHTDPVERILYVLEQMGLYLEFNSNSTEYKNVSVLYANIVNIINETNYKKKSESFLHISKEITDFGPYTRKFWEEYLKFMRYKLVIEKC